MNKVVSRKHIAGSRPVAGMTALDQLRGKRVLVTGACGTVGRRLLERLMTGFEVDSLIALDHNESELAYLEDRHSTRKNVAFQLCDVRDGIALSRVARGVDVVFHAAACKHVHICERSPMEAILTNILAVQKMIQVATDNGVTQFLFTSSDKAVNPTNVMGVSKLMGERLVSAAAAAVESAGAVFASTRFGNVIGSRGSIIPLFYEQIRRGGPVTVTDPDMTRFIMSLEESVDLVIESVALARPGDVLIPKMNAVRIGDLATTLIRHYAPIFGRRPDDIEIKLVGPRPGEKLYEELMNEEETRRAVELDRYYVVRPTSTVHTKGLAPAYRGLVSRQVDLPYNSANSPAMDDDALLRFLVRSGLVHDDRRIEDGLGASS